MKKIYICDILLNICALFIIIVPNLLCYGLGFGVSPLLIEWIAPVYLLIINIKFSKKHNEKLPIWRLFHSVLILGVGYYFSYKYVEHHYISINQIMDPWTGALIVDVFIFSAIVIVLGFLIYQIKVTKKKKILLIIATVIIAILIFLGTMVFIAYEFLCIAHYDMISSKPDASDWVLQNDEFTVVPTIDDDVTFHIEDKDGNIKYVCDREWRAWDFKSINIDKDNNVEIDSSDTGTEIYVYNGETWTVSSK